jgi:epoxyqueuosine reductase
MNDSTHHVDSHMDYQALATDIKRWGLDLGFQRVGITDTELQATEGQLQEWLDLGYHGEMDYMWRHGSKRTHPAELVDGTLRVISARMDYLPPNDHAASVQADPAAAFISRYALGRDYHKTLRKRLQKLANQIEQACGAFGYRVFVDSAPVMEKPLAVKAGLGWMGKHSNLINRQAGSWFFLGEIYTDLPLPMDQAVSDHCGKCVACLDICPTQAIVAPYQVDARLCISYLTIELQGAIPLTLRPLMGNHIYGCDDCMMICPWNRFASPTPETDFLPRHDLDTATLRDLFCWTEEEFLRKTEGSPIRRIGYERWLRNIAVALGNGPATPDVLDVLQKHLGVCSELVDEHINWAVLRLGG